ncbi:M48 family metalloprotease [Teredinibacter haidensis]|uniref:M48 family metalloprotease n=1 Tax=Teredinibacter haidensis TaxID=2731755 RepID=UPI000948BC87|nr:M48 family metalloprotease [Teredinibacter haidensis]
MTWNHFVTRIGIALLLALTLATGCTVNQVTGKRQLSMSFSEQVQIGSEQYGPAQQQQGGRYSVDPDVNVYINQVGQAVAAPSPVRLPFEFVVLNNDEPNAWALPGGKIAINRGLLVMLEDEAQLAAVLGHEVVHAAAEHSANQMRTAQIIGIGVLVAGVAAEKMENENAALIGLGAAVGAQAFQARYGRNQELEADNFGIDYMVTAGYDPMASVELQQKFVELSANRNNNFLNNLFASHPPSQERVDKNKAKAAQLPSGKRNRSAFQRAIAQLKKDQPAYNQHVKALAAATNEDYEQALSLTNKAIKSQPNESLFYITKGKILMAQNQAKSARDAFSKANSLNPDYFMGQLGLGLSEMKLKRYTTAKPALTRSYQLLPTSIAVFNLGEIEVQQGNRSQAIEYFRKAANENSEVGKAAQQRIQELTGE